MRSYRIINLFLLLMQSYAGLLGLLGIIKDRKILLFLVVSMFISPLILLRCAGGGSDESDMFLIKIILFGLIFRFTTKSIIDEFLVRNILKFCGVIQIISLVDYSLGGSIYSFITGDLNIYNFRYGSFFGVDVANYGLWSAFILLGQLLYYRRINLMIILSFICCFIAGTRWPLLIVFLFMLTCSDAIKLRWKIMIVLFGLAITSFGDRSLLLLGYELLSGTSETLTDWLLITGPALQFFHANSNIFFGDSLERVYGSLGLPVKFAYDSSVSLYMLLGIYGTLIYCLSLVFILGMRLPIFLVLILISTKGLYVFNLYAAVSFGLIQVIQNLPLRNSSIEVPQLRKYPTFAL